MTEWPELHYLDWQDTCKALHLYLQIVGKYRLAHTPWQNHSWHATLYVDVRGLTTSLIPDGSGIQIDFDLVDHLVIGRSTDGKRAVLPLKEGTVAEFKARFANLVASLGGTPHFSDLPSEVPDPVRFSQDTRPRPYDADAVARYFRALVLVDSVYKTYRTGFIGKSSPVHLFWGAMDLAVTRFSGGAAPVHPGNIPGLPDAVTRDAYDHQCASAGFWPGGIGSSEASFYAYTYPVVEGYPAIEVSPGEAVWDTTWGEFLLPYEAVRRAKDPAATLMKFLQTTFDGAARLGNWPSELAIPTGKPLRPRATHR